MDYVAPVVTIIFGVSYLHSARDPIVIEISILIIACICSSKGSKSYIAIAIS